MSILQNMRKVNVSKLTKVKSSIKLDMKNVCIQLRIYSCCLLHLLFTSLLGKLHCLQIPHYKNINVIIPHVWERTTQENVQRASVWADIFLCRYICIMHGNLLLSMDILHIWMRAYNIHLCHLSIHFHHKYVIEKI